MQNMDGGVAAEVGGPARRAPSPGPPSRGLAGGLAPPPPAPAPARRADRDVERRRLVAPRGWRSVLPAFTTRQLVLAQVGRLQERQLILAHRGSLLLHLRRQRRNPAVGRIHDERRSSAHALVGREDGRVVGAAHVLLAPACAAALVGFAANRFGPLLVELGAFLVGEELPVRVLGGPLQRDLAVGGPDALQVRFAPGGAGRGARTVGGRAGPQAWERNKGLDCPDQRRADQRAKSSPHRCLL